MKKSIIVVAILVAIVAALPIVGNSFMKEMIDTRVNELESFGLKAQTQTTQSSYLSSSRHFEFVLEDSDAFVEYLNKYSNQQISPYVDAMLNGVVIGADIEYSNLSFAKAIEVEIYPLSLPTDMKDEIRKEDLAFATYLEKFLESKGVLYHINYNILNSKFKGYIQDIETSYDFNKELKVDLKLNGATFSGEGELIAPKEIKSKIKSFHVNIINKDKKLNINLAKLSSKSEFDSKNSYETDMKLKSFEMLLRGTQNDANITMDDVELSAGSDDTKEKSKLETKVSVKEFRVDSKELSLEMKKFAFELKIKDLDKEKYEVFRSIASRNDMANSLKYQKDVQNSLLQLIEKGLTINMKEFSVKEVIVNDIGNIKGFDVKTEIIIKEDATLGQKIAMSPLMAIGNLEVHLKMKIDKKMYSYIMQNPGMMMQLNAYAKEDANNVIFNIDFVDSKVTVNGQALN
jgi:hypothetical protein